MMKPKTAAQPAAVERPRIVPASAPPRGQSTDKPRRDIDKVTSSGKERVRPPRSCAKCGELGRRSDTCGITHNIGGASKPLTAISTPKPPTYSPAEIEAAKARSKERRDRIADVAKSSKPVARVGAEPEVHEYDAENLRPGLADPNAEYELPVPRSSFSFTRGDS